VGAGTVLTPEQVDEAIAAGAKFIVSPGLNPRVVKYCLEKNVPVLPGCATPREVEQAMEPGLKAVKFFPAEAAGGVNMIKNLLGAFRFTGVKFMPTGGVKISNVESYLAVPEVVCCGGTWIVPKEALVSDDYATIERLASEASSLVRRVRA
jgi:2-dehydro-3-deoxyphosphogluconate aldolase/(4S)-4-hydroxy-2-oxoglutarate aldolase